MTGLAPLGAVSHRFNLIFLNNNNFIYVGYFMTQQSLKGCDHPLMRISLYDSILVTLLSIRGRAMDDNSIAL